MYIEGDFFAVRRPRLVAETVDVFTVALGVEGVVAGADGFVGGFVGAGGVLDLREDLIGRKST